MVMLPPAPNDAVVVFCHAPPFTVINGVIGHTNILLRIAAYSAGFMLSLSYPIMKPPFDPQLFFQLVILSLIAVLESFTHKPGYTGTLPKFQSHGLLPAPPS